MKVGGVTKRLNACSGISDSPLCFNILGMISDQCKITGDWGLTVLYSLGKFRHVSYHTHDITSLYVFGRCLLS